jgi:hypothetical protein
MNQFPRYSRFDNHLIQALPHHYCCAECRSQLIYTCGMDTESADCFIHPFHTGLTRKSDVPIIVPDNYRELKELIRIDPTVASIVKIINQRNITLLFGEE